MPRNYTVTAENVSVTTANGDADLLELDAATDLPVELYGIKLYVTSELQEAQEEWLRFKVIRGHTTSGNGTATTPRPVSPADAAAGFAAETYGATIASAGTAVDLDTFAMNVRAGYEIIYPEGSGFWTSGTSLLVVRLMAAPADDVSMNMSFLVREYP
jgi:hypothetical protein